MEEKELNHLAHRLQDLTPVLVEDLYNSYQTVPVLLQRYDNNALRSMAEQGVVSFRDIVIGALEFNAPGVVSHELSWLDRLLHARQIDSNQVHIFLKTFQQRLRSDLTPAENGPLLELLDSAEQYFDEKMKAAK